MSVGTQNLCRLHYVLFYFIFVSLSFGKFQDSSKTLKQLTGSDSVDVADDIKFLIGLLFFSFGNAFAAAAQAKPKTQRKMVQYVLFPLYVIILYINNSKEPLTQVVFSVDYAQNHLAVVVATIGFILSTHTLYIA